MALNNLFCADVPLNNYSLTHEELAEQTRLETVQVAEQKTSRQFIAEASQKLSEAVEG